jgi:hypothetical protein
VDLVEVAPRGQRFELLSDLGDFRKLQSPGLARIGDLIAGRDENIRVVRAAYSHRDLGKVLVEYQWKRGADRHPVCVSTAADSLGLPHHIWTDDDREAAYSIGTWARDTFEQLITECKAEYGMISVENSLPTPSMLKTLRLPLSTEIFVAGTILHRQAFLESGLRDLFATGDIKHVGDGIVFSGWAPFNSQRTTLDDPDRAARKVASLLGDAF